MSGGLIEFDLVIRSEVEINAALPVVWNYLSRVQEWKPSVTSVERVQGAAGSIGEVLRLGQRSGDDIVHVIHKTLQLEGNNWRVQSLETEDGRTARGYLVYSLYERGAGTLLAAELLARACIPEAVAGALSAEQASRKICEATRAKFHADHLALKRLIENE